MKTIITLFTLIFSLKSFACLNKAPLSAIQQYIAQDNVPGVTCEERPEDECLCFDGIENWKSVNLVQTEVDDISKPILVEREVEPCSGKEECELKLQDKKCNDFRGPFISEVYERLYCIEQAGFQKKIIHELRNDPVKKAAFEKAEKDKEKDQKDRKDKKKADKVKARADIDSATTIAQLRKALKDYIDASEE